MTWQGRKYGDKIIFSVLGGQYPLRHWIGVSSTREILVLTSIEQGPEIVYGFTHSIMSMAITRTTSTLASPIHYISNEFTYEIKQDNHIKPVHKVGQSRVIGPAKLYKGPLFSANAWLALSAEFWLIVPQWVCMHLKIRIKNNTHFLAEVDFQSDTVVKLRVFKLFVSKRSRGLVLYGESRKFSTNLEKSKNKLRLRMANFPIFSRALS